MVCLTACNNASATDPFNLNLWHYYSRDQEKAFLTYINEFNETKGKDQKIHINATSYGGITELENALMSAAHQDPGSDKMPDLFFSYADTAYQLDNLGMLASLESYYTAEELSLFNPYFLQEGRFGSGDSLKLIPFAKSTEALFINKTYFDAFVAACPDEHITLDDLKTIEGLVRVSEIYYRWCGKSFYGRDSLSNYFVIGAKQLGTDIFSYTNDTFTVSTERDVYRALYDNYFIPYIKGLFTAHGKFRSTDIQSGKIICYTGSTSSSIFFPASVVLDNDTSDEIESYVVEAPCFADATQKYAVSQGAGMGISKSTSQKEKACVEFIKWMTEAVKNRAFASQSAYMPVYNSAITDEFISSNTGVTKQMYEVCQGVLEDYVMYSSVPSMYGSAIRAIFDVSLQNLANAAVEKINQSIQAGKTKEEAEAPFLEDAYFLDWYTKLMSEISSAMTTHLGRY